MDDSKIIWYIILGAIYIVSRVLKKKKPTQSTPVPHTTHETKVPSPPQKQRSPVEDLLADLSREMGSEPTPSTPAFEPIVEENLIQPVPKKTVIESVPHKEPMASNVIDRDKPVFEKAEKFEIEQEENPTRDKLHELLTDSDGVKSAIILQEVFQRKY